MTTLGRFQDRVAVVTGAGSGIGRAVAKAFAEEGGFVTLVDINRGHIDITAQLISCVTDRYLVVVGDAGEESTAVAAVSDTLKAFGQIDFLVNNAGVEFVSDFNATSIDDWDRVHRANCRSAFLFSKECLRPMKDARKGVIINNSSDTGVRGAKLTAAYSSSKSALVSLTKSLALDFAEHGIRCNCVCPGCIDTPLCREFNAEVSKILGVEDALRDFISGSVPMKRVGNVDEVANVVMFLCSDEASYVTGAIIPIDGGLCAGSAVM